MLQYKMPPAHTTGILTFCSRFFLYINILQLVRCLDENKEAAAREEQDMTVGNVCVCMMCVCVCVCIYISFSNPTVLLDSCSAHLSDCFGGFCKLKYLYLWYMYIQNGIYW